MRVTSPARRPASLPVSLALAAIACLAYANSFTAGFPLDNRGLILLDTRVHTATSENVDRILNHSYWWPIGESGLYRPVTTLSYLVNYAILGNADRSFGYHVVNLLLHIGNVLLVYALMRRIAPSALASSAFAPPSTIRSPQSTIIPQSAFRTPPFAIAALWSVHPLSTEAVTNIVGRADLLAAMCVLGGLLLYIRSTESRGARRIWVLIALGVVTGVGVFAKESAVVIAPLILLYAISFHRADASSPIRACAAMTPAFLLLWMQRAAVLGAAPAAEFPFVDNPVAFAGFWTGRWTALVSLVRYLWLAVWPARLSADYSYAQIPLASGTLWDWAATGAVVVAGIGTVMLWRRSRPAFFLAAFALLTWLPASNLLFAAGTILAERVMYLPLVGLVALLIAALDRLTAATFKPAFAIVVCVLVAACAARTWIRNSDWRDDLSLWSATVEAAPASFKAHRGLAEALYESDPTHANIDRIVAEHERAVSILDPLPDALNDARTFRQAGADYTELGDRLRSAAASAANPPAAAQRAYERAAALLRRCLTIIQSASGPLKATPAADANRLLSAVYVRLRSADSAIATAARARELEPDNVVGYRQAAAAYLSGSRNDEAATVLMTGSMITGDQSLRDELVDLYRRGLDPLGCAVVTTPNGPAINPVCDTVKRHACAAAAEAVQIHTRAGRRDEAQRLRDGAARQFHCQ